jgi:hypothetical protein
MQKGLQQCGEEHRSTIERIRQGLRSPYYHHSEFERARLDKLSANKRLQRCEQDLEHAVILFKGAIDPVREGLNQKIARAGQTRARARASETRAEARSWAKITSKRGGGTDCGLTITRSRREKVQR